MLAFSVVIVSKIGGKILLTRRAQAVLLVFGAVSLSVGLYLHLNEAPAANKPRTAGVARRETPAGEAFTFTFSPPQARWGDQVEIQVPFSAESVTVYLNGVPLPKRVNGGRTVRVTIPSGTKTGFLELERDGTRARASEPISVNP
jgi:hypothetical protein